jgi:hypothetical protein
LGRSVLSRQQVFNSPCGKLAMMKIRQALVTLALAALAAGPVWAVPALSAHQPTLSPVSASGHRTPVSPAFPLGLVGMAGAISVKDTASVAAKFVQRAGAATQDYTNGVQGAGGKWSAAALASEPNYVAGVTQAAQQGRYGKGIQKRGPAKYQDNASKLGSQRYGPGVQNAQAAYTAGVDPYLNVIKGLDLPARGPKGSPQNQARANAVAVALRKAKVGG